MKRLSALNTWVGSIVGAIPPIMGYTAMIGHIEPGFVYLFLNLIKNIKISNSFVLFSWFTTRRNLVFVAVSARNYS